MADFGSVPKDAYGAPNRAFAPDPAGGSDTVFKIKSVCLLKHEITLIGMVLEHSNRLPNPLGVLAFMPILLICPRPTSWFFNTRSFSLLVSTLLKVANYLVFMVCADVYAYSFFKADTQVAREEMPRQTASPLDLW